MTTVQELEVHLSEIIDRKEQVLGEIYMIRNKQTGLCYIGQTLSHRLNHGRYRPYGYTRRFNSHVSEALINKKSTQCRLIADAIREHGADNFEVILLQRCLQSQMDDLEMELIQQHNTLHPNGYNMARGGRFKCIAVEVPVTPAPAPYVRPPQSRDASKSEETKKKISEGLRKYKEDHPEHNLKQSSMTKKQHLDKKFDLMMHMKVQIDDLDSHLRVRNNGDNQYIAVTDNNGRKSKIVSFYDKANNIEDCRIRAREFLQMLHARQQQQE